MVYHLSSTFFQTVMLWLLAYVTLFLHVRNLNERFMGALTALLVLAALLGSMKQHLPLSSHMNFIDFWFLWYITNIFAIIVFHVVIDGLRIPIQRKEMVNKSAVIILPVIMLVFNMVYFSLCVMQLF